MSEILSGDINLNSNEDTKTIISVKLTGDAITAFQTYQKNSRRLSKRNVQFDRAEIQLPASIEQLNSVKRGECSIKIPEIIPAGGLLPTGNSRPENDKIFNFTMMQNNKSQTRKAYSLNKKEPSHMLLLGDMSMEMKYLAKKMQSFENMKQKYAKIEDQEKKSTTKTLNPGLGNKRKSAAMAMLDRNSNKPEAKRKYQSELNPKRSVTPTNLSNQMTSIEASFIIKQILAVRKNFSLSALRQAVLKKYIDGTTNTPNLSMLPSDFDKLVNDVATIHMSSSQITLKTMCYHDIDVDWEKYSEVEKQDVARKVHEMKKKYPSHNEVVERVAIVRENFTFVGTKKFNFCIFFKQWNKGRTYAYLLFFNNF